MGTGTGTGAVVGAVVRAGAGAVVGAVDAGVDEAAAGPPTEEEMPAAAAGWMAAGWDTTEPAELCMGTELEPAVVVLGRAAGIAAGIPAGVRTARGRYASIGCGAGVDKGPLALSPLVGDGSVPFWTAARSRIEHHVVRLTVAAALIPAAR